MLYLAARKTATYSSKAGKMNDESLQRNVAAVLLGFLIILIIVIATSLW
jgi:hypothetical protein